MKQHPVPQNITTYQFRLVGDMTLKQFLELASGIIIAYLFFHLKIPFWLKWPLVFFNLGMGLSLAFLPINGRPLDRWLLNFLKAIYSPTLYLYQKNNSLPDYLQEESHLLIKKPQVPLLKNKNILQEFLQSLSSASYDNSGLTSLDQEEEKKLEKITKLFENDSLITASSEQISSSLSSISENDDFLPAKMRVMEKPVVEPAPVLTPPLVVKSRLKVKEKIKPKLLQMVPNVVAMPQNADTANVVVGMVLTPDQRILPNALIEIKDSNGQVIRALKTNQLGHFRIASPLENGNYQLTCEADNYNFEIINFKAEGKIIPAFKIVAKNNLTFAKN